MLKIRLQRIGRKNDPSFRVVAVPSTQGPKSGKFVEVLGNYDPRKNAVTLQPERIKYWISVGAQVSPTVHNLLVSEKVIDGKKVNVLPRKSPIKSEEEAPKEAPAPQESGEDAPQEEEATKEAEAPLEEKKEEAAE